MGYHRFGGDTDYSGGFWMDPKPLNGGNKRAELVSERSEMKAFEKRRWKFIFLTEDIHRVAPGKHSKKQLGAKCCCGLIQFFIAAE